MNLRNYMKNILLSLTIPLVLLTAIPAQSQTNPFLIGTQIQDLTPSQRTELEAYIRNAKILLEDALREASGQSAPQQIEIYERVILRVVKNSIGRAETLMRVILAQAFALTYGIPDLDSDPSGNTLIRDGEPVLADEPHLQLSAAILRDSIRLAIQYHQTDLQALQRGSVFRLPIRELAAHRLSQIIRWWVSVFDSRASLDFIKVSMYHVMNIIRLDGTGIYQSGDELLRLQDALDDINSNYTPDTQTLDSLVRQSRGVALHVTRSLDQKLRQRTTRR